MVVGGGGQLGSGSGSHDPYLWTARSVSCGGDVVWP